MIITKTTYKNYVYSDFGKFLVQILELIKAQNITSFEQIREHYQPKTASEYKGLYDALHTLAGMGLIDYRAVDGDRIHLKTNTPSIRFTGL